MTRAMLGTVMILLLARQAWAVDVAVSYLADAKAVQALGAADQLDVAVFGDPECTAMLAQHTVQAGAIVIERVRTVRLRGAAKPPRLVRLTQLVGGVPAAASYYARVTGDGVAPIGGACQAQAGGQAALVPCLSQSGTDVYFTGCNVHVRNGQGSTHSGNGLGNLIVGYDEPPAAPTVGRDGSHNVIVGAEHEYATYSSLVVGYRNATSGAHTIVTGMSNRAAGPQDAVLGGWDNTANGPNTTILGGQENDAEGANATVLGGRLNRADGDFVTVCGGTVNVAQGPGATVVGGHSNGATGDSSIVAGGVSNAATGAGAAVMGGTLNGASGTGDVITGGRNNATLGDYATISAGTYNRAFGDGASVSGGHCNSAGAGPVCEGGGQQAGGGSSISGGALNRTTGAGASVTGGTGNLASAPLATVCGGEANTAAGVTSVVGGGTQRTVSGHDDWAAGSLFEDF